MSQEGKKSTIKPGVWFGLGLGIVLFVGCVLSLPWAAASVVDDVTHPAAETVFPFTPEDVKLGDTYTRLHLDVVSLDEVNHVANVRANGFHFCPKDCDKYKDRVIVYQVDLDDAASDSIPPSEGIAIPTTGAEITQKFSLPLRGSVQLYPFDTYHFGLGVVIEREQNGAKRILTPAETNGQLEITFQEQVPRVDLMDYKLISAKSVMPKKAGFEYAYVNSLNFGRPAYLKVVVMFVAILTLAIALFTMITRPFDQLVINAGALILGVWGARNLVLGGYPADVTLIDTLLTATVLFMLLALTLRGVNHFHRQAGLTLLPWAQAEADSTKKCLECLNKIPKEAKRCGFCTSLQSDDLDPTPDERDKISTFAA